MSTEVITFSFGQNWSDFIKTIGREQINSAEKEILKWLPEDKIAGARVIDIGCGSGLSSFCLHHLGAGQVVSFDYDPKSVAASQELHRQAGSPANWDILHGSILDRTFVDKLRQGGFDIVYSWGVLHHTGEMWKAIQNAASLCKPGGLLQLALYAKGPKYLRHLRTKRFYNRAGITGKRLIESAYISRYILARILKSLKDIATGNFDKLENPFAWNIRYDRGMTAYHDIIDWLGGLPYEVVSVEEMKAFGEANSFRMIKFREGPEGGNHTFLFEKI